MVITRKLAHFSHYKSLIFISLIACLFGSWFCSNQIAMLTTAPQDNYPVLFSVITILKCYLTILAFYAFSRAVLLPMSCHKLTSADIALSFLPLLCVFAYWPMYWIVVAIFGLQIFFLLSVLRRDNYSSLKNKYLADAVVLGLFILLHFYLTTEFSPLHWKNAILASTGIWSEEIPVLSTGFKGFLLAKQFSFANIDYSQWSGIMNPPVSFNSPFMQLMAFILDLPSVDIEVFHKAVMATFFVIFTAGSFGFYLFLRYAAKLGYAIPILGGFLFFFSGSPVIANSFLSDGGVMLSAFITLPYAMLFITLAFEHNSARYAALASLALASQFFIFAPHPEGTLYSLFFFMIYSSGLFLFSKTLPRRRKFNLVFIAGLIFTCLTSFAIFPIITDRLFRNMYAFAHIGDAEAIYLGDFYFYFKALLIAAPVAIYLLQRQKQLTPVFKSSLLLTACLLGLFAIASSQHTMHFLIKKLHIGIHFWVTSRLGVYLCMSVFIMSMYALHAIVQLIVNDIHARLNYAKPALWAAKGALPARKESIC